MSRCPITGESVCRCDAQRAGVSPKETLRKIFEDHIIHTKFVTLDILFNLPFLEADLVRLMENQEEIGNFLAPVVGRENADLATSLLKEHIRLAGEAVKSVKNRDQRKLTQAKALLLANADQISDLLYTINPQKLGTIREMFRTHIYQLLEQTAALASGQPQRAVRGFDASLNHMLMMADALTAALD